MSSYDRIKAIFHNQKAFIPFITAGDPSLELTEQLVPVLAKAGADLIELGIPFSDPVAEGEVIQKADIRALAAGTTIDKIFQTVKNIRLQTDVPLAFMTYINPIFVYGAERFVHTCARLGMDALIVPDLPFEEKGELLSICQNHGIALISLIAPTSRERIKTIAREAQGFVYCVSSMGVTGVRSQITTDIGQMVSLVKEVNDIPCAIGFGISTPEQAKEMAAQADGVIVGSAIVRLIQQHGENAIPYVKDYVTAMKQAVQTVHNKPSA